MEREKNKKKSKKESCGISLLKQQVQKKGKFTESLR